MLKEEIKSISSTQKDLRNFAFSVGGVLLVIGAILYYYASPSFLYFAGPGGVLILLGGVFPKVLKPLQIAWMTLAVILGFVMTRVILALLYFGIFLPIGLISRIFGKQFIEIKWDKNEKSYWNRREQQPFNPSQTETQF